MDMKTFMVDGLDKDLGSNTLSHINANQSQMTTKKAVTSMSRKQVKRGNVAMMMPISATPSVTVKNDNSGENSGKPADGVEDTEFEKPPTEDKQEMFSYLWVARTWLLDCSAHGIPKVLINTNFNRKGFWLFAFTLSCLFFLYQVTELLIDLQTYPVTVNMQINPVSSLRFPTVTVCNANKLKLSEIMTLDPTADAYKILIFEGYSAVGLLGIKESLEGSLFGLSDMNTTTDIPGTTITAASTTGTAAGTASTSSGIVGTTVEADLTESGCFIDREYLGEVQRNLVSSGGWWDYEYEFDYSFQLSPDNEFKCDSGECISHVRTCDSTPDCSDYSDESVELCTGCASSEFACLDGNCIAPQLRCDSVFDCPDGSDEEPEFCNPERHEEVFVCCNSRETVALEHVCDGFDDCASDKSDQYLMACVDPTVQSFAPDQPLFCPRLKTSYADGFYSDVQFSQIGDGVIDCLMGLDETCSWKQNLHNWTSPTASDAFAEYKKFLDLAQNAPSKTRWYTMTDRALTGTLSHKIEDFILQCTYDNTPCGATSSTIQVTSTVSQDYGNCYSWQTPTPVSSSGPSYGLSLMFNLETYDSLGFFAPDISMKMFLTEPGKETSNGELFIDFTTEINLAPGFKHSVDIHPVGMNKLSAPFSECEVYGEGSLVEFNTKTECETFCRNKRNFDNCGCVDDVNFLMGDVCTLDDSDEAGRQCVDAHSRDFDAPTHCDCPPSCVKYGYQTSVSPAIWPTRNSIPNFFTSVQNNLYSNSSKQFALEVLDVYSRDQLEGRTSNALGMLRDTFGRVDVYFSELSETSIEERAVYDAVGVISTFGGLLGLYMGFSLLTVLELFDFIYDMYEMAVIKTKRKRFAVKKEKEKIEKEQMVEPQNETQNDPNIVSSSGNEHAANMEEN